MRYGVHYRSSYVTWALWAASQGRRPRVTEGPARVARGDRLRQRSQIVTFDPFGAVEPPPGDWWKTVSPKNTR